jgi:hypothetical protein
MYLSTLGRYVAALGGRLEIQAVFDEVEVTVPLVIANDVGPVADLDLMSNEGCDAPREASDVCAALADLGSSERGLERKQVSDRGPAEDAAGFVEFFAELEKQFQTELPSREEIGLASLRSAFFPGLASSADRGVCVHRWDRDRWDLDLVSSWFERGKRAGTADALWAPLVERTLACHAAVSRESSNETRFARFLMTTVKPALLLQAIMFAAPTRHPLPIRRQVGRDGGAMWSGCAVPVGLRIKPSHETDVGVFDLTEIAWENAADPDEKFTAALDEVELLEACNG